MVVWIEELIFFNDEVMMNLLHQTTVVGRGNLN